MKEEKKKNISLAVGRFVFGLLLAASPYLFLKVLKMSFQIPMFFPVIIGIYFMISGKFRIRLDVTLLIIVVIALGAVASGYFQSKSMTDAECAAAMDLTVSDIEFGISTAEFSKDSGIYPTLSGTVSGARCRKAIPVYLYDANGKRMFGQAYNLYPEGDEGQTGYGNYNAEKSLEAGAYSVEASYGDVLIKKVPIVVK